MFNPLRLWLRLMPSNPRARRAPTARNAAALECLESRYALSIAPFAIPPLSSSSTDAGELVSSEHSTLPVSARGIDSENRAGDFFNRPLPSTVPSWLSNLPSGANEYGGWMDAPSSAWENDAQTPYSPSPNESDLAPMIDIGQLDKSSRPQPQSDTFTIRETRDVLQLLDSLKYVPRNLEQVPAASVAPLPPAVSPTARTAEADPLVRHRSIQGASEGGMVTVAAEAIIDRNAEAEGAAIAEAGSVLDVPVQMDSEPGKYQAFEVSTAEAAPPPRAPSRCDETSRFLPRAPAESSVLAPARPALHTPAAAGDSAAIDAVMDWIEDSAGAPLSLPQEAEETSGPSLNVAAAATFLAFAAQAAYNAQLSNKAALDPPRTSNGRRRHDKAEREELFRHWRKFFAPLERRS